LRGNRELLGQTMSGGVRAEKGTEGRGKRTGKDLAKMGVK